MKIEKKIEQIPKTALDERFRQICTDLIEGANQSVYIIAGEMGSLYFPDMHAATAKAHGKGAKVLAYATEKTPAHLRNFALSIGVKLYIGSKPLKQHYLVVDGKHFVKSINKPTDRETIPGEREGEVHYNDPEGAEEIIRIFEELCSNGKLVTTLDKKADPLYQFLYGK